VVTTWCNFSLKCWYRANGHSVYCDSGTNSNHILKNERSLRHVLYKPTLCVADDVTGDNYGCSPGKRFPELSKERKIFIFKNQVAFRNIKKYDPSDAASHHRRLLVLHYSATRTSIKHTWRLFVVTMPKAWQMDRHSHKWYRNINKASFNAISTRPFQTDSNSKRLTLWLPEASSMSLFAEINSTLFY